MPAFITRVYFSSLQYFSLLLPLKLWNSGSKDVLYPAGTFLHGLMPVSMLPFPTMFQVVLLYNITLVSSYTIFALQILKLTHFGKRIMHLTNHST